MTTTPWFWHWNNWKLWIEFAREDRYSQCEASSNESKRKRIDFNKFAFDLKEQRGAGKIVRHPVRFWRACLPLVERSNDGAACRFARIDPNAEQWRLR
jgi:hypothetical protein